MVQQFNELPKKAETAEDGSLVLTHNSLCGFDGTNPKVRMFSLVELESGKEVPFHTHTGENETYFFLSGNGIYSDNGTEVPITPGLTTFCPDGEGHGVRNTGDDLICFVCMIVVD